MIRGFFRLIPWSIPALVFVFTAPAHADMAGGNAANIKCTIDGKLVEQPGVQMPTSNPCRDLKTIEPWGVWMSPLINTLEILKAKIDSQEWPRYDRYYQALLVFKDVLQLKAAPKSDRAMSYLSVTVQQYLNLERKAEFRKDLGEAVGKEKADNDGHGFADGRIPYVQAVERASENMLKRLVQDKEVYVDPKDGLRKLRGTGAGGVLGRYSKYLRTVAEKLANEIRQTALHDFLVDLRDECERVASLEGGSISARVAYETFLTIDEWDRMSYARVGREEDNIFYVYLNRFKNASRNSDQTDKYLELAGDMDHLISVMESIKAAVHHGVGADCYTYNDFCKKGSAYQDTDVCRDVAVYPFPVSNACKEPGPAPVTTQPGLLQ